MNQLLFPLSGISCPASRCCDQDPCFQAWLEAAAGSRQARMATGMCARHWGEAIHALTAWALAQGMTGQLTILAADRPSPGQPAVPRDQMPAGFAFTTIKFSPTAPVPARAGRPRDDPLYDSPCQVTILAVTSGN